MMRYYAYIDESQVNTDYYLMSSVIIRDSCVNALIREVDQLFLGLPEFYSGNELHAYPMFQGRYEWKGFPIEDAIGLTFDIFDICNKYVDCLHIEIVDRARQLKRYEWPRAPRSVVLQFIFERINEYMEEVDASCVIVIDHHQENYIDIESYMRYRDFGTMGFKSSRLERIEKIEVCDSKDSRALQIADLCAYIANQNLIPKKVHPRTRKIQRKLWNYIHGLHENRTRIWPK